MNLWHKTEFGTWVQKSGMIEMRVWRLKPKVYYYKVVIGNRDFSGGPYEETQRARWDAEKVVEKYYKGTLDMSKGARVYT